MFIFSRRYLLAWKPMAKYLGFVKFGANSQGFMGINPKYLAIVPPWLDGISKKIPSLKDKHCLHREVYTCGVKPRPGLSLRGLSPKGQRLAPDIS